MIYPSQVYQSVLKPFLAAWGGGGGVCVKEEIEVGRRGGERDKAARYINSPDRA